MSDRGMSKMFFYGFAGWFILCAVLGIASLVGLGYAVYWGLSIAETAVEQTDGDGR